MDYSLFKPLFGLLMFGAVFVFGFAQLAGLREHRRSTVEIKKPDNGRDADSRRR